jgi:hypothetical protein
VVTANSCTAPARVGRDGTNFISTCRAPLPPINRPCLEAPLPAPSINIQTHTTTALSIVSGWISRSFLMSPHRSRRVLRWSTQGRPFAHGRNTASVPSISLHFSSDIQLLLLLPSTAIPYKLALGPPPCLPRASRGQVFALLAPPPSSGTQIPCVQAFRHCSWTIVTGVRMFVLSALSVGAATHPTTTTSCEITLGRDTGQ